MLEVDPALIVQNIYSNSELINEDKENSEIGLPKEDVLNQLNLIGVPSQFIELLAGKIDEELGSEILRITKEEFLLIFSNWIEEFQNADEGSYYNDSFADLCNASQLSDTGSRPDLSGIYSQGDSPASSISGEENRDSVSQLSSITRSFSIPAHLNRPLYDETISVGSYTGYGGQSPVKKLKESNSMELCNSKLATEIANYKTYYQKSLSENERLQQTLDVKEKDFKATADELEQLKKQYKMMKLTNENLNSDIDHMNEIREASRKKDLRIRELEHELKSVNEDCEKAWERANTLSAEKSQLISDLEEETSKNIVLRQEMTIDRQAMANQMKELRVDCEELRQNLEDEKVRCAQVVKESEARCREVEEYKARVSELEEKMHDSGEVIYFAPEESPRQKNLQDELECSKDYKHFQFEELQSLKKKLDKETRKAEAALKDKKESEEIIARLERELKSVRAMTQARSMPEPVVSKVEVATVSIQTSPVKEFKKEETKKLSEPAPKQSQTRSHVRYPVLSTIFAIWCALLSILILMISNWEGPIVDYSCPTLSATLH